MTVVKAAAEAAAATEMPEPSAPPVVFGPVISGNLMEKTFHDGNPDGGSHSSSEAAPSGGEDDHDGLTVGSDSDSRLRDWDELSVCTDVENPLIIIADWSNEVKPSWLPPDDDQAVKVEGMAETVAESGFGAIGGANDIEVTFNLEVE